MTGAPRRGERSPSSASRPVPTFTGVEIVSHLRRLRVARSAVAASAGVALVAGVVVGVAVVPPLGLVAGLAAAAIPFVIESRRRRLLRRSRLEAWPDALGDLHTSMRAARSLNVAIQALAERGPDPLRPAFSTYRRLATALPPATALDAIRAELDDPVSGHVLDTLAVALDLGPGVVLDVLADLADAATAEIRLAEDIETAELETRLEARAASVLPFVILALLCVSVPGYRDFYASPGGWFVIGSGAAMTAAGLVLIARLARHEVAA